MRTVASVREIPQGIAAAFIQPNGTVHCYDTMAEVPVNLRPVPPDPKAAELEAAYAAKKAELAKADYDNWLATDPVADAIKKK